MYSGSFNLEKNGQDVLDCVVIDNRMGVASSSAVKIVQSILFIANKEQSD